MAVDATLPFVEMLALETLKYCPREDNSTYQFMGRYTPFNPSSSAGYGGHVYAQSVWAAAQTVSHGMVVHNVHGYFTLPVYTDRPLFYSIQSLSSGRSYCTRFVTARQPLVPCPTPFDSKFAGEKLGKLCFVSMCSFKKDESATTKHQIQANLKERYGIVLKDNPEEHRLAPRVDSPWWYRMAAKYPHLGKNEFPGLDIRRVDMSKYNASKPPEKWRQLSYYRPIGHIPPDSPNLHACAHLYASDRNSLFLISNAVGFGDEVGTMGSLSHSVVFHVNSQDLMMKEDEWWCQEAWTPRSEGGRGMHESRIWDPRGVLVASTWQDGLVRKAENESDQRQRLGWLEEMRRIGKLDASIERGLEGSKL